jgi:hypothetical protein
VSVLVVDEYYYNCSTEDVQAIADKVLCPGGVVAIFSPWQRIGQWYEGFFGIAPGVVRFFVVFAC